MHRWCVYGLHFAGSVRRFDITDVLGCVEIRLALIANCGPKSQGKYRTGYVAIHPSIKGRRAKQKSRPPDNFCFTFHVQISTSVKFQTYSTIYSELTVFLSVIMVWITNRSSETIKVVVTNPGGDPGTYEVVPEALLVESWRQNYWTRTTPETATVTFTKKGVQFKTIVNPKDVLLPV